MTTYQKDLSRHTYFVTIVFLFVLLFSLLALLSITNLTHAQGTDCSRYSNGSTIPSGFSAPYDLFSSAPRLLLSVTCGSDVEATAGTNASTQFIYKYGYQWDGSGWDRLTYDAGPKGTSGNWMVGRATSELDPTGSGNQYVLAYICQWISGSWKCGCNDASCSSKNWQIQSYRQSSGSSSGGSSSGGSSSGGSSSGGSSNSIFTGPDRGTSAPPKGGYDEIDLIAPTATLPSIDQCLSRVHHGSWEPRQVNADENANTSDLDLPDGVDGVNGNAQNFYLNRIEAVNQRNITGTTDELMQFFACYWGFDDESIRARADMESTWDQDVNGDVVCNGRGESWGLLQIKNRTPRGCTPPVHDHTYPDVFVSTGNNLNYAMAWQAACYRGDMSIWIPNDFMSDPERRARECIGLWFSGSWRSGNSQYLSEYDGKLRDTPWLNSNYDDNGQQIANVCRTRDCDTLPTDD